MLAMLQAFQEQQAAIAAILIEEKVQHLIPVGNSILEPFQKTTKVMRKEMFPASKAIATREILENDTPVSYQQ